MTTDDFGLQHARQTLVKGLLAIIVLLIMFAFDWNETAIEEVGKLWATILAFLGLLLFWFLMNLISAPRELQIEADQEILSLKSQLDVTAGRQEALNELWRLRSVGISLRNRPVATDQDFEQWRHEFEEWRNEVLKKAEVISVNLRNWLERLDRVRDAPKTPNPHHNNKHKTNYQNMSEILLRMQEFLERDLKWPSGNI